MIIEQDTMIDLQVFHRRPPLDVIAINQKENCMSDEDDLIEVDRKGAKQLIKVLEGFVNEND